jgi:hypothetical protein
MPCEASTDVQYSRYVRFSNDATTSRLPNVLFSTQVPQYSRTPTRSTYLDAYFSGCATPSFLCGTVAQTCLFSKTIRVCGLVLESFLSLTTLQANPVVRTCSAKSFLERPLRGCNNRLRVPDVVPVKAPYTSTRSVCMKSNTGQYQREDSSIVRLGGSAGFLSRAD